MKTIALLFFFWGIALSAAELDPKTHSHIHYCYLMGKRYAFAISDAKYSKMRHWNPNESPNPPVSAKRALDIAKARLDAITIPKTNGWRLERISLQPVNDPDDKWMYVVSYRLFLRGPSTGYWPTMDFIVTMDGELVEPIIDAEKRNR